MNVREFIEWLELFPDQTATVQIISHTSSSGNMSYYCQGGEITIEDFDPDKEHFEYTDMRGNPFAKGKSYENDHELLIGSRG